MITKTIPSYLYVQYQDDADVQSFVNAYNTMSQEYLDWFVQVNLPVYTGLSGQLLDWIGTGIYGVLRPMLQSSVQGWKGDLNTMPFNGGLAYNQIKRPTATGTLANDDIYKRVITWSFYKGDGQIFNFDWLKRRIIRFLFGENGADVRIASVYGVNITVLNTVITINLNTNQIYNASIDAEGRITYGIGIPTIIYSNPTGTPAIGFVPIASDAQHSEVTKSAYPLNPNTIILANIFESAVNAGILALPFQFTYVITIT